MNTIDGLPAHVLLVHGVVVLVPLTAVLLVLTAWWPAARSRLSLLSAVLGVVTLVAVPLTTDAGEWLEHHVARSPLVHEHTELGDTMLPWAIGLAVLTLVVLARHLAASRTRVSASGDTVVHGTGGRHALGAGVLGGFLVTVVVGLLAVVVAVGSVVTVVRIGESGSRAAWTGRFSTVATSGPGVGPPPTGAAPAPVGDDG